MKLIKTSEDVICRCGICMSRCIFPFDGQDFDDQDTESRRYNFGAISAKTLTTILNCPHVPKQPAVIFVGGFLDTLSCNMLKQAQTYSALNPEQDVWYGSYDSTKQITEILQAYNAAKMPIILVGHSWGGDAAARLTAATPEIHVDLLVTLDPVSKKGPPPKSPNLDTWINFYVDYRISRPQRANFLAKIGGPWNVVPQADMNISQKEWGELPSSTGRKQLDELHHADVCWMLCCESLTRVWNEVLPDSNLGCAPDT